MAERLVTMTTSSAPQAVPWARPNGLLLDAMGTLITLRQSVGQSYASVAQSHAVTVDAAAIDAVFPQIYRQAPPLAFGPLEDEELLQAERHWWGERIYETFAAVGAPAPPPALRLALFEHFAHSDCWRVYDDVRSQLDNWRAAGLRLAVVSNFDRRLHGLLQALDLAPLFDAVVVSSEAGAAKPDPRPFELALTALQLQANQVWHVGDSPEDLAGAKAAGLACVLIERTTAGGPASEPRGNTPISRSAMSA